MEEAVFQEMALAAAAAAATVHPAAAVTSCKRRKRENGLEDLAFVRGSGES